MKEISRSALDDGDLETKLNLEREDRVRDRGLRVHRAEDRKLGLHFRVPGGYGNCRGTIFHLVRLG